MLIQLLISTLIGIFSGTITGLIPGIHINLVGVFLISIIPIITIQINPLYLITFVVSMAITHTFLDFIPSIFLGCPDTDTELSILPGHELLKEGLGYHAIMLATYGSLAAIILLPIIAFPSIFFMQKIKDLMPLLIPSFLILISLFLISKEKNKIQAITIFLISGILGVYVLNYSQIKEPLLPLLSGLFGTSMMFKSIQNKTKIPEQKLLNPKIKIFKPVLGALLASPLCSFLPGVGSGQAAIIGNSFSKTNKKEFLVLLGATNTLVMGFSFLSLYAISKTRTGAAVTLQKIIETFSIKILILIIIVMILSGIISFFWTKYLARKFSQKIDKINYTKLSKKILIFLFILIFIISGIKGLILLIISTLIGIYSLSLAIKKTNMMGCLLLPSIIYYLF